MFPDVYEHYCSHPGIMFPPDVVTGIRSSVPCSHARLPSEQCGPTGSFFEEKPPKLSFWTRLRNIITNTPY
jgi:hypothetical protein